MEAEEGADTGADAEMVAAVVMVLDVEVKSGEG